MKILQVHNRYKTPGGEWTALRQEYNLLSKSHEVDQFLVKNSDELNNSLNKFKLLYQTHYNHKSKRRLFKILKKGEYEVMHVHNFFPLLSPSIFEAARKAGIPSIMSLHNYRLIHPNALMYHKGKLDHRSVYGSAYECVLDGVYRDSIIQTAVTAHMIEYHRKHKTWHRYPTLFIALSEFSKKMFVEGGLPEEKIMIKPNFLPEPLNEYPDLSLTYKKSNYFLFAGRISSEKGIEELVTCWMNKKIPTDLLIAGEGPLKQKLMKKTARCKNIIWLGQLNRKEVLAKLSKASALLFPTRCYEGMPLIMLEAMSMGCPVISSDIGNPKNMIEHRVNGLLFRPGDTGDLYEKVKWILDNTGSSKLLGENSRKRYLELYTPERNYSCLMNIYRNAMELEESLSH